MEALNHASVEQLQQVLDKLSKKRKRDADYLRENAKRERLMKGGQISPTDLAGRQTFVANGVGGVGADLARLHLTAAQCQEATLFVVASFSDISSLVLWNAVLAGGIVCTLDFLKSGSGPVQSFKAAMGTRRLLWITDGFIEKWPLMANSAVHRKGA